MELALSTERDAELFRAGADDRIRLSVPGTLAFRDVAVRVVGTACRLLRPSGSGPAQEGEPGPGRADFSHDEFSTQVVSAFSEAFNNVAIHGYRDAKPDGNRRIDLEIASEGECFVVCLRDFGGVFDPGGYLEVPDELPERGMGLFIIRSFMDEVAYAAGPPNLLTLKKRWPAPATSVIDADPSLVRQPG